MKINFNETQIIEILNLYVNKEMSTKTIGNKFGVSKTPITSILREKGVLKKGTSNGVKINLTLEQKDVIKNLYLIKNKNPTEISKYLNLTTSFIDKYLSTIDYRRNKSEAISIVKTGVKLSEKTKLNMKIAQQNLSKSGNRIQTGGICKYFLINGLKCQGTYEKFYIESLIKDNKTLPTNGERIITPYGVYTPDFQLNKKLIEIKSDYTYNILIGNKISRFTNKIDLTQYNKIKWVNDNISKIDILIIDKRNNKINKIEL